MFRLLGFLALSLGVVSGPPVGSVLPGPFHFYNMNAKGKGRLHCMVLENQHKPTVLVFAREPAKDKDGALNELLTKLDASCEKLSDDYLQAFVVFLSPDGKSSATEGKGDDPFALVKEAENRIALEKRLEARAENVKKVVIGYTIAEGPKGYKIHPDAETTVLFYRNLDVVANFAFEKEKMTEADVDKMVEAISKLVKKK